MKYRTVTYIDNQPHFGTWTDMDTAHREAKIIPVYAWVENENHERIEPVEMTTEQILEREG